MTPHVLITGHQKVISVFGHWPGFHDGEVHRLVLDSTRRDERGARYSSIVRTSRTASGRSRMHERIAKHSLLGTTPSTGMPVSAS